MSNTSDKRDFTLYSAKAPFHDCISAESSHTSPAALLRSTLAIELLALRSKNVILERMIESLPVDSRVFFGSRCRIVNFSPHLHYKLKVWNHHFSNYCTAMAPESKSKKRKTGIMLESF